MALDTKEEIIAAAEDIFGQYLYSVGAGAGQLWVKRRAIRALRDYYFDSIVTAVRNGVKWKLNAPHILSYMRTIGALAADFALAEGLHAIGMEEMMQAVRKVEYNYNRPEPRPTPAGDPTLLGAWCPEGGG